MARYWHPYLADLLRRHCGQVLEVQETVTLGDLPLEADLLLIRRDPAQELPFPYNFLGQYTLVEYKSPDDTADQAALVQLESYGLLWLQRARQIQRSGLTLWLVASRISQNVSTAGGAEVVQTAALGPGLLGGRLDGFPICLVDLQELPFTPATLPLHMVSRGKQERALVEYLVEQHEQHPQDLDVLQRLHPRALVEVLHMRNLSAEQIGLDCQALLELIGKEQALNLIGKEQALNLIGKEQALNLIGKEQALNLIGKEQALGLIGKKQALDFIGKEEALDLIGKEEIQQWLQRQQQAAAQGPATPPPTTAPSPEEPNETDQN